MAPANSNSEQTEDADSDSEESQSSGKQKPVTHSVHKELSELVHFKTVGFNDFEYSKSTKFS